MLGKHVKFLSWHFIAAYYSKKSKGKAIDLGSFNALVCGFLQYSNNVIISWQVKGIIFASLSQ